MTTIPKSPSGAAKNPAIRLLATDGNKQFNSGVYPTGIINVKQFGAVGDGLIDDTSAIQAAADAASASNQTLYFPATSGNNYLITTKISITGSLSIRGENKSVTVLCSACSAFEYASDIDAKKYTIEDLTIAHAIRHTTTSNTNSAITMLGSTTNRPYWNTCQNLFIDGFGTAIKMEWAWEQTITNVYANKCGDGVRATGTSVNNRILGNSFVDGAGTQLNLGDGTNPIEGWYITDNLLYGGDIAINGEGAAFCTITGNIIDYFVSSGIVIDGTSVASIGNKISKNYIAGTSASTADEGIRIVNNVSSTQNKGSTITENEIWYYSGGGLTQGILIDGTNDESHYIAGNRIDADTSDIKITAATDCKVVDNHMFGAGINSAVVCEYHGNTGTLITSIANFTRSVGTYVEGFGTAKPTTGTYTAGHIIHHSGTPVLDGNNMVLVGWIRLTTGSGHTLGTDWAAQYISHVTPAT